MINVTIADGRKDLYQWDIDRILKIDGAPDGSTVNFINKEDESPLPVLLENGTVTIPNSLLQVPRLFLKLYVWHNDHTIGTARLRVIVQPKPDGYMATEDEILTWDKLFDECGRYLNGYSVLADLEQCVSILVWGGLYHEIFTSNHFANNVICDQTIYRLSVIVHDQAKCSLDCCPVVIRKCQRRAD